MYMLPKPYIHKFITNVSTFISIFKYVDNWPTYFMDKLGFQKKDWVVNSQGMKLKLRKCTVDRWIFTENIVIDEYKLRDMSPKDYDTIFDVGANIGAFTIASSHKFRQAKFYAFEPNIENYNLLIENIKLNNIKDRVKTYNAAVTSSKVKKLKLYLNQDLAANSIILGSGKYITTNNFSFSSLNPMITNKSLLKLDIEGGEYDIFKEANINILKKFKKIIMEYHNISQTMNGDVIEKFLLKNKIKNFERNEHFFYINLQ